MLINCTNHPVEMWSEAQREAAGQYGEVKEMPFPPVDPAAKTGELRPMVAAYAAGIEALRPDAVLVAGEFTFTFMLVDKLLSDGVKVLCTCSKRVTEERKKDDGTVEKISVFRFERFREYAYFAGGRSGRKEN